MLPSEPAARHRAVAAQFSRLVRGTSDWSAPAPVPGWTARDVVDHLVSWFPAFVAAGGGPGWPSGPAVSADPAAAWQAQADGVQALLDDPGTAVTPFAHPRLPPGTVASCTDTFYTSDVFMHAWDLAAATGQPLQLDPDECAGMLAGMEPIDEMLRASGQYGPRVEVPEDADVQSRLIGFIGRDPSWKPPVTR